MSKITYKGDVEWRLPKRGNPVVAGKLIASSNKPTKLWVEMLSRESFTRTVAEVAEMTGNDLEAKEILQIYIDEGYGDIEAYKLFGFDRMLLTDDEVKECKKKKKGKTKNEKQREIY